jgi:hypothetical protein
MADDKITGSLLIAQIRELAKKAPDNLYIKPDPKYNTCCYDRGTCTDGSIGCIFGQAFRALGLELKGTAIISYILSDNQIPCSGSEKLWCATVQRLQDQGRTWSEAVKLAG